MSSLSTHLREDGDHGRLGFRPDCPTCRSERLHGSLASGSLFPPRAQAAAATGVIVVSTGLMPAAGMAVEPDSEREGAAAPPAKVLAEPDPGGPATDLPPEAAVAQPLAPAEVDAEGRPVETEPTEGEELVADDGDQVVTTTTPAPASPAPSPTPLPEAPAAQAEPPPAAPSHVPPAPAPVVAPAPAKEPDLAKKLPAAAPAKAKLRRVPHRARSSPLPRPSTTQPEPVSVVRPTPSPAAPTSRVIGEGAAPGDGRHTVRPGESLWSIARDNLGGSPSPAPIAREVNRLWTINATSIATGDPDLLRIGTRLEL